MRDNLNLYGINKPKCVKLKGHVKITLHNCRTGKNEVIEGENMVTHAVRDIFANNYLGGIDFSKLLPLYSKWFGGILCYSAAHTLDADNYYPQASSVSRVVAHAGDQAPSTPAIVNDDLTRGYPIETLTGDNYIRQTWEWGANQGNTGVGETIQAISLTHADTGNVGLGNSSQAFQSFNPFENISNLPNFVIGLTAANNVFAEYDDHHGICYYRGQEGDFVNGSTKTKTNYVTVFIKKLPYSKVGLYETQNADVTNMRKFTIQTDLDIYCQPSFYFDKTNKELWLFHNLTSATTYDASKVDYVRIPCPLPYDDTESYSVDDYTFFNNKLYKCTAATSGSFDLNDWTDSFTIAHGTFSALSSDLAPVSMDCTWGGLAIAAPYYVNVLKEGNYFYFPTTSGNVNFGSGLFNQNGWRRINPSNPADQDTLSFLIVKDRLSSVMAGGGLVLGNGIVTNGSTGYPCAEMFPAGSSYVNARAFTWIFNEPNKVSSYAVPFGVHEVQESKPRYILANKMVNTTLFNLDSPITKNTSKSMQIQYTLTEVEVENE